MCLYLFRIDFWSGEGLLTAIMYLLCVFVLSIHLQTTIQMHITAQTFTVISQAAQLLQEAGVPGEVVELESYTFYRAQMPLNWPVDRWFPPPLPVCQMKPLETTMRGESKVKPQSPGKSKAFFALACNFVSLLSDEKMRN